MVIEALDYRNEQAIAVEVGEGDIVKISKFSNAMASPYYIAPGLVDLQINGFKGIDFNSPNLTTEAVTTVTQVLLERGVTSYFPTLITNSDDAVASAIKVLVSACEHDTRVNACIGGIHLEGPFLSLEDGPRGAHPKEFIKAPDWELFETWQQLAQGRIRLITLSPEWPEAFDFIKRCVASGVVVSIGHTAATPDQINLAINAGARMSTHLGNASHALLPRHSNYVWEQLASEHLWSSLIADGFHLPDALLKIFLKVKPDISLLVSDATSYADLPAGSYSGHIGGDVVLDDSGRLYMANSPQMLAGSAQSLLWCVNQLVRKKMLSLPKAWEMASLKPTEAVFGEVTNRMEVGCPADLVVFKKEEDTIKIIKTIKSGQLVFSNHALK